MFVGYRWSKALFVAFPGVVLAVFISLAYDQREQSPRVRLWLSILLILSGFFMYVALSFNEDYLILVEPATWAKRP